jgi:hypothetical protein
MKIEPNISHGFKIDSIKFQIWKPQIGKKINIAEKTARQRGEI